MKIPRIDAPVRFLFQAVWKMCKELAMELWHDLRLAVRSFVFSVDPFEDQPGSKDMKFWNRA